MAIPSSRPLTLIGGRHPSSAAGVLQQSLPKKLAVDARDQLKDPTQLLVVADESSGECGSLRGDRDLLRLSDAERDAQVEDRAMPTALLAVAVGLAATNVPLTEGSPKYLSQVTGLGRYTRSAIEKNQETRILPLHHVLPFYL